jgi:polyisoprenoid-binding protein YceI
MTSNTTTTATDVRTYTIDPSHSRVGFTVRHMGFSKVRGRFEAFEGTVQMEPGVLESIQAEVNIEAASIDTNEPKRDAHLRTGDFFLVDEYPKAVFRSTGVKNISGNTFTLVGELTLRGVTRTVALAAEYNGEGKDPWGGTRVAFEARTKINRKDFGLNWNVVLETGGWLVSEDVEIALEIQAVEQPAA